MGLLSGVKAIREVGKIRAGGTGKLSYAMITNLLINLPDAAKKLSPDHYKQVSALYDKFQKCKTLYEVNQQGYMELAKDVILRFDEIAPYELYSGGAELEYGIMMQEVRDAKNTEEALEDVASGSDMELRTMPAEPEGEAEGGESKDVSNATLFELIVDNIQEDDTLSDEFTLPPPENMGVDLSDLVFVDGFSEGVRFFYNEGFQEEPVEQVADIVALLAQSKRDEAISKFLDLLDTHTFFELRKQFAEAIYSLEDDEELLNTLNEGFFLIHNAHNRDVVKLGLSLIWSYGEHMDDKAKRLVRTVALCNEFTIYAFPIMQQWKNAEEEILNMARHVRGWGRIMTVNRMPADNPETKEWLFHEGWQNTVSSSYVALTCYAKCDYLMRLSGAYDEKTYYAAQGILNGMLEETAAPGISYLEERQHVLDTFLDYWHRGEHGIEDYDILVSIMDYADDNDFPAIKRRTENILSSDKGLQMIDAAMDQGRAFSLGARMGLDYKTRLIECVAGAYDEYFWQVNLLMDDDQMRQRVLELSEKYYENSRSIDWNNRFEGIKLDYIIQHLKPHPGEGQKLLKLALTIDNQSPQNMALSVLEEWTKQGAINIREMAPQLVSELERIARNDSPDDLINQDRAKRLLA